VKAPCASAAMLVRAAARGLVAATTLVVLLALLPASASALSTIYFRAATSGQTGTGASSLVLAAPALTAVGDTMILDVDAEGTGVVTPPAGWTQVYAPAAFAGVYSLVFYRVATVADVGASYTINLGSSRTAVGRIVDYVGTSSTPLQGNTNGGCAASCTNTMTYSSFTTTSNNSMLVLGGFAYKSGASTSISTPAGTNSRVNLGANSSELVSQSADYNQTTAGASGAKTATLTNTPFWGSTQFGLRPAAAGALAWNVAPFAPDLPTLALNGGVQTLNAVMGNFSVDDTTGSSAGWNVTVNGDASAGKSAVFKEYCNSGSACGSVPANSYATGGATLPAGSLKLNTTGASWTGGSGTTPAFQCSAGCSVDAGSATKIVSVGAGGGLGPWKTSGFSATSLALTAPTTTRVLATNEVYRVNVVWSLTSGP
jgi:hypothetical protein